MDGVCGVVAFDAQLLANSTTTVPLRPDQEQRVQMTAYAAAGQAHRYPDLLPSNGYLPVR